MLNYHTELDYDNYMTYKPYFCRTCCIDPLQAQPLEFQKHSF